ncbi:Ankyrin-2 [Agyrium rufum]|nr:Ankyrin-2 [Agyrium rufum]
MLEDEHVLCFVDALDECPEDQVRDMIEFFEDLVHLANSTQKRFHVCYSSRRYPQISIGKGLQVILEDQEGHSNDIEKYLSTEFKAGKSKQIQEVTAQILVKASGIFLWVVLVVQILNKEYDHGRIHALRKRLNEIPAELNELFRDILMRDGQNLEELEPIIPWDPEEITLKDMERFVISSSKGLAETTRSTIPTIQSIHESVREFLLKENAFAELWPGFGGISRGDSHDKLKNCCHKYTAADVSVHQKYLLSSPGPPPPNAVKSREIISQGFPFLKYAVYQVLYHANAAEKDGVSQSTFLKLFARKCWIELHNMLERYPIRHHTEEASLLYILAEKDLVPLIEVEVMGTAEFKNDGERYGSFLHAAVVNESEGAVAAILCHDRKLDLLSYTDKKGQTPLLVAAKEGYCRIAQQSLDQGAEVDARRRDGATFLWIAVTKRSDELALLLLNNGATADIVIHREPYWCTPWIKAVMCGNKELAQLLLKRGADANCQDLLRKSALRHAVEHGHTEMVRLILESGADVVLQMYRSKSLLHYAAKYGHTEVARLLLESGADVNHGDDMGTNALHYAAKRGHVEVFRLLLGKGIRIDKIGMDALYHYDAQSGHKELVQLFRERGAAGIDRQDHDSWTALMWATRYGK